MPVKLLRTQKQHPQTTDQPLHKTNEKVELVNLRECFLSPNQTNAEQYPFL